MNELIEIFTTANMLQFTKIQNQCVTAITSLMTFDNVLEVWQIAERFNSETLLAKSRYLAVTEFQKVIETNSFLDMDCKWLFKFLANRNLMVDHEMNVFKAGMLWLTNNNEHTVDRERIIYILLSCLDFNELSIFNIMEIQKHSTLKNLRYLTYILQHIIYVRNKESGGGEYSDDIIDKAKILQESKRRHRGGLPTFTLCNTLTKENEEAVRKLGLGKHLLA